MEKLINLFKIEFTKGDTYALAIKFKNITEDLRLAYFSVKDNPDDAPLIQKSLGAGIDKIDDRAYKNEKTYKFQLQPADTLNLEANVQYLYDIQVTIGNVVKTVLQGVFMLRNTITGATAVTTADIEVEVDEELEAEFGTTPATNGVEYEQDPVACLKIGDMKALTTEAKQTIVQAVNEVNINGVEEVKKIKSGETVVPNCGNLKGAINYIPLSEIFEENGQVVKVASVAKTAQEVNNVTIERNEDGRITANGFIIPVREFLFKGNESLQKGNKFIHSGAQSYVGRKFEVQINGKYFTFQLQGIGEDYGEQLVVYASYEDEFHIIDGILVYCQHNTEENQYELVFEWKDFGSSFNDYLTIISLYEIID